MCSTVDQPCQVQDCHQSKQEAHEEAIPQGFPPKDEWHHHRHQHGQDREQYFVISVCGNGITTIYIGTQCARMLEDVRFKGTV